MFSGRIPVALVTKHGKCGDQFAACEARLDDLVHVTALRGDVRVGEFFLVLGDLCLAIAASALVKNVHRAFGAHDRDLRRRVGEVHVRADVLGVHDAVRAAVSLPRDHRDLRHRRLGQRVKQLRAMNDDAAVLLIGAGEKTRNILEYEQRNVERIAETDEARALAGCVDVENAGQEGRLIGDDANRVPVEPDESDDEIARVLLMNFEKVAFIGDDINDLCVFELAGLSVCPADTFKYIKERTDLTTIAKGGEGVLREVADLILAARGEFEAVLNAEKRKG